MKLKTLLKTIKCKIGIHNVSAEETFKSTRVGNISLLNEHWKVSAELVRSVNCMESCCLYCNERIILECETIDIPIGI